MRLRQAGMSIIEMMIAITILGLLIMIGLPNMTIWLNNSQIRTAGETMLSGLTLARTEAVRRNAIVRFNLVSDLTSSCVTATGGTSWVVSLADPAGGCDAAPSESGPLLQVRSGSEGTTRAVVEATGAATAHFNGLGRLASPSGAANMTKIEISNPTGGTCQHLDASDGTMRCLRINISPGGEVKMCDPAVSDATDPRKCPA
jgi:type IV fimbrial biogenesis protein FimT